MNNKTIGNDGEATAIQYLEQNGYAIIDTNVRPFYDKRRGEIDIIAWEDTVLCIVEVKTRVSDRFDANDSITRAKRRQLTRLAQAYMAKHNIVQNECRFDVVCVYNRNYSGLSRIDLTRGAFDPVY